MIKKSLRAYITCSCTIFLVDKVNNWKFFQFQYTRSYAIVKAFFTHIIMYLSNFCTLRSESATKKRQQARWEDPIGLVLLK